MNIKTANKNIDVFGDSVDGKRSAEANAENADIEDNVHELAEALANNENAVVDAEGKVDSFSERVEELQDLYNSGNWDEYNTGLDKLVGKSI